MASKWGSGRPTSCRSPERADQDEPRIESTFANSRPSLEDVGRRSNSLDSEIHFRLAPMVCGVRKVRPQPFEAAQLAGSARECVHLFRGHGGHRLVAEIKGVLQKLGGAVFVYIDLLVLVCGCELFGNGRTLQSAGAGASAHVGGSDLDHQLSEA